MVPSILMQVSRISIRYWMCKYRRSHRNNQWQQCSYRYYNVVFMCYVLYLFSISTITWPSDMSREVSHNTQTRHCNICISIVVIDYLHIWYHIDYVSIFSIPASKYSVSYRFSIYWYRPSLVRGYLCVCMSACNNTLLEAHDATYTHGWIIKQ